MSHKITDRNIVGMDPSKHAALMGDANEMLVAGILTRWGFEVGLLNAKGGSYDIWLMAFSEPKGRVTPLRVQVKTVSEGGSIKLGAGTRGGKDRYYGHNRIAPGGKKLENKEYKYTTKHNDLIIGVDPKTLDLYLVPTRFIERWGKSKATNKLQSLKNNYDVLLNWNDGFLSNLANSLPDTSLAIEPEHLPIQSEGYLERT